MIKNNKSRAYSSINNYQCDTVLMNFKGVE